MDKSSRGVENPNPTDMALIGNTLCPLHTASLPRKTGPNFGYDGAGGKDDDYRVTGGSAEGEVK